MSCYLFEIVDLGNGDEGEAPQVAVEEHGLRVCVAYDANARCAVKLWQFRLESCAEICVFKIVDGALEALLLAIRCHTAAACAEV